MFAAVPLIIASDKPLHSQDHIRQQATAAGRASEQAVARPRRQSVGRSFGLVAAHSNKLEKRASLGRVSEFGWLKSSCRSFLFWLVGRSVAQPRPERTKESGKSFLCVRRSNDGGLSHGLTNLRIDRISTDCSAFPLHHKRPTHTHEVPPGSHHFPPPTIPFSATSFVLSRHRSGSSQLSEPSN